MPRRCGQSLARSRVLRDRCEGVVESIIQQLRHCRASTILGDFLGLGALWTSRSLSEDRLPDEDWYGCRAVVQPRVAMELSLRLRVGGRGVGRHDVGFKKIAEGFVLLSQRNLPFASHRHCGRRQSRQLLSWLRPTSPGPLLSDHEPSLWKRCYQRRISMGLRWYNASRQCLSSWDSQV